jgi:hypothetical protein
MFIFFTDITKILKKADPVLQAMLPLYESPRPIE